MVRMPEQRLSQCLMLCRQAHTLQGTALTEALLTLEQTLQTFTPQQLTPVVEQAPTAIPRC